MPKTAKLAIERGIPEEHVRLACYQNALDAYGQSGQMREDDWLNPPAIDQRTLRELEELDFDLVPLELPDDLPVSELSFVLTAEASTVPWLVSVRCRSIRSPGSAEPDRFPSVVSSDSAAVTSSTGTSASRA